MNWTKALGGILAAATLVLAGCHKPGPAPVAHGKWDPIKLGEAFQDSPIEVHTVVDQAVLAVRRTDYGQAIAALEGLSSDERVTPAQKAALTNAVEQIKSKANAAAAAAPPQ